MPRATPAGSRREPRILRQDYGSTFALGGSTYKTEEHDCRTKVTSDAHSIDRQQTDFLNAEFLTENLRDLLL